MVDYFDSRVSRPQRPLSRRRFLQGTAASVLALPALRGLAVLAEAGTAPVLLQSAATCQSFGVFDPQTFATIAAVAAQIIPTDDTPGAADVCTTNFVELSAAGNPALLALLTKGATGIDESSTMLYGAPFVALTFANQTEVLKRLEAGTAPGRFWNDKFFKNYVTAADLATPPGLQHVLADLSVPVGPMVKRAPNFKGQSAQQVVFGTCRTLTKLAWVINWPEAFVRDPNTGQPYFSDADHLISDPDAPGTGTCWDVIRYHVIDWETEKLLWAWQAGMKVTGFANGWPVFAGAPLTEAKRLAARDALYELSNAGSA